MSRVDLDQPQVKSIIVLEKGSSSRECGRATCEFREGSTKVSARPVSFTVTKWVAQKLKEQYDEPLVQRRAVNASSKRCL